MNKFDWGTPQENWCKMPNALIDALPLMKTVSEVKVVLYILRHTWGYHEFDTPKRLTMDDFENGRKDKDGQIDEGVGLSINAIRDGIKAAVEHGLITVIEDNRDLARQKRYYMLGEIETAGDQTLGVKVRGSELGGQTLGVKVRGSKLEDQTLNLGDQTLGGRGSKLGGRTKKDTLERNLEKEEGEGEGASAPPAPVAVPAIEEPEQPKAQELPAPTPAREEPSYKNGYEGKIAQVSRALGFNFVSDDPEPTGPKQQITTNKNKALRDAGTGTTAYEVYEEYTTLVPTKAQLTLIAAKVTDLKRWREALEWCLVLKSFRANNFADIFDVYENGPRDNQRQKASGYATQSSRDNNDGNPIDPKTGQRKYGPVNLVINTKNPPTPKRYEPY